MMKLMKMMNWWKWWKWWTDENDEINRYNCLIENKPTNTLIISKLLESDNLWFGIFILIANNSGDNYLQIKALTDQNKAAFILV